MNRSQLADKARQLQIPESESYTIDQDLKGRLYATNNSERFRLCGVVKRGAKTHQEVLQVTKWRISNPTGNSRDSLNQLKMQSVRSPRTQSGKQCDPKKLFAQLQESNKFDKRRKIPERKATSSAAVLEEEKNFSLKEQVRQQAEQVQLLTPSLQVVRGELGNELCEAAEAHGKNTMTSTTSPQEMSWMANRCDAGQLLLRGT